MYGKRTRRRNQKRRNEEEVENCGLKSCAFGQSDASRSKLYIIMVLSIGKRYARGSLLI